jgi:hypothetical protein
MVCAVAGREFSAVCPVWWYITEYDNRLSNIPQKLREKRLLLLYYYYYYIIIIIIIIIIIRKETNMPSLRYFTTGVRNTDKTADIPSTDQ